MQPFMQIMIPCQNSEEIKKIFSALFINYRLLARD